MNARMPRPHDMDAAWVAMAALGTGAVAATFGSIAGSTPALAGGGALLACGALLVLAGRWVEPLILLAAVLVLPPIYSGDTVRISPAFAVNALIIGAWVLHAPAASRVRTASRNAHAGRAAHAVTFAALALPGAALISAPFASDAAAALREIANWILFTTLLALAVRELARSAARRRSVAIAIAVVGAAGGALAALEALGILPGRFPVRGTPFARAALGFGWPNELAMFLALTLPFAVSAIPLARTPFMRRAARAGAALVCIGLLATFSRASWLAVLIAPVALLFVGARRTAVRFWAGALLLAFLADLATGGALQARIAATFGDWVVEQRAALTLAGLVMFAAHPVIGVGPGGFASALDDYGPRVSFLWDYLPTAQNGYVQMAAETGVIGLAALAAFVIVALRTLRHVARGTPDYADLVIARAAFWSAATAAVLAFNEWIFAHGVAQLLVLAIALGAAVPPPSRPEPAAP